MASADQLHSSLPLEFQDAKSVGGKGLKVYALSKPLTLKLSDACDLVVPFSPGVFNGKGNEERVNICFTISDEWIDAIKRLENECKEKVGESTWASCIKETEGYAPLLKAKLQLTGEKACKYYDEEDRVAPMPLSWNRIQCNAMISIRGIYSAGTSTGLQLDVTHIQYCAKVEASPF